MIKLDDMLLLIRRKHAGAAIILDALCKRYGIDGNRCAKHGALLDAQILLRSTSSCSAASRLASIEGPRGRVRQRSLRRPADYPCVFKFRLTDIEREQRAAFADTLKAPIWVNHISEKARG